MYRAPRMALLGYTVQELFHPPRPPYLKLWHTLREHSAAPCHSITHSPPTASSLHLTPLTGPKCTRVLRVGRRKVRVGSGTYFFFYLLLDSVLLGVRSLSLYHLLHPTPNPSRSKILHLKLSILYFPCSWHIKTSSLQINCTNVWSEFVL